MIKRIWHGWTTHENADIYEALLLNEVMPAIAARRIPGYRGFLSLRRSHDEEVEFITIMTFDSLESVTGFMGDDYTLAHVPEKAQAMLSHWDERSRHYEVRASVEY